MICTTGKFSLLEQLWMQITFDGIWILGLISISIINPFISIVYFLFCFFGIFFLIMHLWICPRCPHIKEYSACSQFLPFLTKK